MVGLKACFLGLLLLLLLGCPERASGLCLFNCFAPKEPQQPTNITYTLNDYGPVVVKAAYALGYLARSNTSLAAGGLELPLEGGASATIYRSAPNQVYVVFQDAPSGTASNGPSANLTEAWAANSTAVPFLRPFLYTAEAPSPLVEAFEPLHEGESTAGALADAIAEVMGAEEVLLVRCVGAGAAGGLAILCGPWAGLHFVMAQAEVQTFGSPWAGFNPQFAWSLQQLAGLYFIWPATNTSSVNITAIQGALGGPDAQLTLASAFASLVSYDLVIQATQLPNLPPNLPEQFANIDPTGDLGELGPAPDLAPDQMLPPSDCPIMTCKTRSYLNMSCQGFVDTRVFGGLPSRQLHDNKTNADLVVSWNQTSRTAIFAWKYTEEVTDWLTDARVGLTYDYPASFESASAAVNLSELIPGVGVHNGFYTQFKSLALEPATPAQNLTAVLYELSNGTQPLRVVVTGFSLGAALAELSGPWVAMQWPAATVLITNQGGPKVGNENWVQLFEATVGRAYKYVWRLDEVPGIPPLAEYVSVPGSIWVLEDTILLESRPPYPLGVTTWEDHDCERYYVPLLYNATGVEVPAYVFVATE